MNSIIFLAELSSRIEWPPSLAIGATLDGDRQGQIISKFSTGQPDGDTYWTDWGGTYDNPETSELEIFFGAFLQQVPTIETLYLTPMSYYVDNGFVYTNTALYPWQYADTIAETSERFGFSSVAPDELNPSDDRLELSTGALRRYPAILNVPSSTLNSKLPDVMSGINLLSTFTTSYKNADGRFDDADETNFFNTPASIYKLAQDGDPKKREDYVRIRYGQVDNIDADTETFSVKSASIYRTLSEEVCRTFSTAIYAGMASDSSNIGKEIPILYGSQKSLPLFELDTGLYAAVDNNYQTSVTAVYDSDDASIAFTVNADGSINATGAKTADVTGLSDNMIGQIITAEIENKSSIPFSDGPWDASEAGYYVFNSPRINFYFDKGDVKTLVKNCLKSDMAFLLEKNDGRLTLRRWYENYDFHQLNITGGTLLTKRPSKKHMEQKYYASSASVQYEYNAGGKEYERTALNDSSEDSISSLYRKKQRLTFPTDLITQEDAEAFGGEIISRFGGRPEIWTVAVGSDTAAINNLDTVLMDINVAGRIMSKQNLWKVTAVNPGQDTLTLEGIGGIVIEEGVYSQGIPLQENAIPAFSAPIVAGAGGNWTAITETTEEAI